MDTIKKVIKTTRLPFKKLKLFIKGELGWLGIPKIEPFVGFGTTNDVFISGMVVEDKGLKKPSEKFSVWQNILAMLKRYTGDHISGVSVKISFCGYEEIVETDENGIFFHRFSFESAIDEELWQHCTYELLDKFTNEQPKITARGKVMIIHSNPDYGVISDIDDTFLVSHSTRTLKKLQLMLFKNALTRKPFEGVSAFYQALHKGRSGLSINPFFYVSSSEWNLHDLLLDFCRFNDIPPGVFMLREMETSIFKFWKSGQGNHSHKLDKIRMLMTMYDQLNFILAGDSGQHDPEIYFQIASEYPGRIIRIYIRDVSSKKRHTELKKLSDEFKKYNTEMILVRDSEAAAWDAIKMGLISAESLPGITLQRDEDREISKKAGISSFAD